MCDIQQLSFALGKANLISCRHESKGQVLGLY